jgi:hypothetical protein
MWDYWLETCRLEDGHDAKQTSKDTFRATDKSGSFIS